MNVQNNANANLGTHNSRSLYFVTNDTARVVIDSTGSLVISKLIDDGSAQLHPLYVNGQGALSRFSGWVF
jgi:hypothetical protein